MFCVFGKNVCKTLFRREAIITVTVSAVNLNKRTVVCLQTAASSHLICEIINNVGKEKGYCVKGNL